MTIAAAVHQNVRGPCILSVNPKEQRRVDANREQCMTARRALEEALATAQETGYWGRLQVTITVEDGEIKQIDDSSTRTHRVRR